MKSEQTELEESTGLNEPLLPPPTAPESSDTSTYNRTVQVVAPSNLEGGFNFQATVDGTTFVVTVPPDGVRQGETINIPHPSAPPLVIDAETIPDENVSSSVPYGKWKDGLLSCCAFGCCHPSLCCALYFPSIAIAQIRRRLMLPLLSGRTTTASKAHCAFWTIILLTIIFYCLPFLQCYITYPNTEGNNSYYNDQSTDCMQNVFNFNSTQTQTTYGTVASILTLIFILMVVRTRRQIRKKYNIPGNCCHDCCAAVLCNCCTVSQMMRHTADYDTYRAVCCSETGMCAGAPAIV